VRRFLADFGVFLTVFTPLACDNQSGIKITTNPVFYKRTKHTLRSTVTLLASISLQAPCHFHIFAQRSRMQISLRFGSVWLS